MKLKKRIILILTFCILFLSSCSNESKPMIFEQSPMSPSALSFNYSSYEIDSTKDKLFFASGSDSENLYYAKKENLKWKISKMDLQEVKSICTYGNLVYFLGKSELLTLYDSETNEIIYQIELNKEVDSWGLGGYFYMSNATEEGIYLHGTKLQNIGDDVHIFMKVNLEGEIEVLKKFPEKTQVHMGLVHDQVIYYDWKHEDSRSFNIYSYDIQTGETFEICNQVDAVRLNFGMQYYIYDNQLVFPIKNQGICLAKLDGTGNKIYTCELPANYVKIDDNIYLSGEKLTKINLGTGEVSHLVDDTSDYRGTLTEFHGQLVLMRVEAPSIDEFEGKHSKIYIVDPENLIFK